MLIPFIEKKLNFADYRRERHKHGVVICYGVPYVAVQRVPPSDGDAK